jgi:Alginate export
MQGIYSLLVLTCALAQTPDETVVIHGSVRSRVEVWDWFDESYAFSGTQARLSAGQTLRRVDWLFELEAPILLGLPSQAKSVMGSNYAAANDRHTNAAMVFVKQGFVRYKDGKHSLRLGRFEFSDGAEVAPADATLAWLKRERIAQRLIGPFGWSHVGRSFDGMQYVWAGKNTNVTMLGARPTRGAFQVDGWGELNIALGYGAVTRQRTNAEWRLFGAYYDDWRNDRQRIKIGSAGGHYLQKSGQFDGMLWGVVQTGRWGALTHRAYAAAVEGGWQPKVLPKLRPWLRAGYSRSSGDSNPNDGTHETFHQLLPTPRPFARTPFFNMMNNEDFMAMAIVRPHRAVTIRGEAHKLQLSESNDLWYTGGGAFQPWTFGFASKPSGGKRDLAALYDVSVDWVVNPHWSVSAYLGHVRGGGVVRANYPATRGGFGYLEATYKF